ncbi:MAG: hypothetical protein AWU54_594 [Candidatus Frackibacter sp. T328-2]|nr:MAG: hypothetical protein AWU54_594 [Candidatus Frackibacter sp. T328-2]
MKIINNWRFLNFIENNHKESPVVFLAILLTGGL